MRKPKGINSGMALKLIHPLFKLPKTPAARLFIVDALLRPPIFDENDNIIGHGKPLITKRQARKLLDMK